MADRLRVLYAEDDPFDADLTRTHFEGRAPALELEIVGTGRECLERLGQTRFDVLLIDQRLPDMDGISILQLVRDTYQSLPVVMITAVGDEALVVQALHLGARDYVPKQGNYLETLPATLRRAVAEQQNLEDLGYVPARTLSILYVEHSLSDVDLTRRHFAEAAPTLTLEAVHSSHDALARLGAQSFDLILADLRMPDMNALNLLREVKQRGLEIPFVVVTGSGDEKAAAAALRLGADDYIVKRENYLLTLPRTIENAVVRSQLAKTNRRLRAELAERKRAEEENVRLLAEVRGQRQRMDEIIASVRAVVWEMSRRSGAEDFKVEFVSSDVERLLGYSIREWMDTRNFWLKVLHPDDRERALRGLQNFLAKGTDGSDQFRCLTADGRVVWMEVHSTVILDEKRSPVGMRGVAVDITAVKEAEQARARLEEELRQAQKLESVGRLAGGIAHDFNNLLTVINGYAYLALADLEPANSLYGSLIEIINAGERVAALTRQLLAFSRRQVLQPRLLDLNSLIQNDANMLRRLLGEHIELSTSLDAGLGQVRVDASQMSQVVVNLAVNGRDAMPGGGQLTLETRNVKLQEEADWKRLSLLPGDYVMLAMSDTGHGMDPGTLAQAFEPFFTTKEPGKGTGLGLSTVYGIIKQSGGSVRAYSEPGKGTRFEIYLPRVDAAEHEVEDSSMDPDIPRGAETVLVVEDEEMVRKLTCRMLRTYGYHPLEATNSTEALRIAATHPGLIPLVITDVIMPGMNGRDLAVRLVQLRREIRVLYMSGYTEDASVPGAIGDVPTSFIQKPFSPGSLARKVRAVLDEPRARPAQ